MAKEELMQFDGLVVEILPDARYRVQLDQGHEIVGLHGRQDEEEPHPRRSRADRVTVEMSPYDLEKGRLVFRHKDERSSGPASAGPGRSVPPPLTVERAALSPSAASAYGLLTATALLWAGNAVTSRWAPGHISAQVITTLRWAIACAVLAPIAGRRLVAEWPVLRPHWLRILLMGGLGYTAFNCLFYAAGAYTGGDQSRPASRGRSRFW